MLCLLSFGRFLRGVAAVGFLLSAALPSARAGAREDFLKVIDRPRVPLAPAIESTTVTNGLEQAHFSFAADARQRVPGIWVRRAGDAGGRRPVVIVMHGTGGRKENELPRLRRLAERGFLAVAIDGRYFGERSRTGTGTADYEDAIVRAYHGNGEHPLYYDTVWDVMRLVDYLETRPEVDARRIGLTGISKGGIETYLAAAADPRFAVVVPFIGVQEFNWGLEHNAWQGRVATVPHAFATLWHEAGLTNANAAFARMFFDHLIPGIYTQFDGPAFLPLIAPRPLLVVNGDSDDHTPLPGVEHCGEAAKRAYAAAGVPEHFQLIIQEHTAHKVNPASDDAMLEWFAKWLAAP